MQVVKPIDIEDALRVDLAAQLPNYRVIAQPVPPDLKSGDVVIYATGGGRVSAASSEYGVSIDCYAVDEEEAGNIANSVHGVFSVLPLLSTAWQYNNATAITPYYNYDKRAPQLARYTFTGRVITPGERIEF